jgi:hypothetical protein
MNVFDRKSSILAKKTWLRHVLTFKGLVQNRDDFKVFIIISFVSIFGWILFGFFLEILDLFCIDELELNFLS